MARHNESSFYDTTAIEIEMAEGWHGATAPTNDPAARLVAGDASPPAAWPFWMKFLPQGLSPSPSTLARVSLTITVISFLTPPVVLISAGAFFSMSGRDPLNVILIGFTQGLFTIFFISGLILITAWRDDVAHKAEGDAAWGTGTNINQRYNTNFAWSMWVFLWFIGLLNGGVASMFLYSGQAFEMNQFNFAQAFNRKVSTDDALGRLTHCFHDNIPKRNATITDFAICLKKLGVAETPDGFRFPGTEPEKGDGEKSDKIAP